MSNGTTNITFVDFVTPVPAVWLNNTNNAVQGIFTTTSGGTNFVDTNIPGFSTLSQTATPVLNQAGTVGILGATESSLAPSAVGESAIGVMGVVVNNAVGAFQQVGFGAYFEAQQKAGAGFTAAIECDSVNQSGTVVDINPYNFFPTSPTNPTVNLWLGAGGARAGVLASTAAIGILQNGAGFQKGIVFETGSINSNEAIALASGHALQWWGSLAQPTSFIQATGTVANYGIILGDNSTFIGNGPTNSAVASFAVANIANSVNYITAVGAAAGSPINFTAIGADTNIDMYLVAKGSGNIGFGTFTAGAVSQTGYITIKDQLGTIRRLLVG